MAKRATNAIKNSRRHQKRLQTDPDYKARWVESLRKSYTPELREKKRKVMNKLWQSPRFRKQWELGQGKPIAKENHSKSQKKKWQNKKHRATTLKARQQTQMRRAGTPLKLSGGIDIRIIKSVDDMVAILRRHSEGESYKRIAEDYRCHPTLIGLYCRGKKRKYWFEEARKILEQ